MSNSVAGPGTGKFVSTRTGNTANLTGTAYYACGTIGIAATITDGRPSGKGVVRVRGKGSRGTFVLRGTATY